MLISGMEQYLHFRLCCPPFYFAIEWGVLILWQTKSLTFAHGGPKPTASLGAELRLPWLHLNCLMVIHPRICAR